MNLGEELLSIAIAGSATGVMAVAGVVPDVGPVYVEAIKSELPGGLAAIGITAFIFSLVYGVVRLVIAWADRKDNAHRAEISKLCDAVLEISNNSNALAVEFAKTPAQGNEVSRSLSPALEKNTERILELRSDIQASRNQ